MRFTPLRCILVILLLACFSAVAFSDVTVKVTGSGSTRTAALEDATRQAVQLAMEQLVITDRKIVNDEIVRDETISTLNGFIKKRKILETRKSNGQVEVEAIITVSEKQVTNYIGDISPGNDQQNGTNIDGSTLGSEIERQRSAADASRFMIEHFLRGFPLNAFDVRIKSATLSPRDNNILQVVTSIRLKPALVKALSQSLKRIAIDRTSDSRGGYYNPLNPRSIVNSWDQDPADWWVGLGPVRTEYANRGFAVCLAFRDTTLQHHANCYYLQDRPNMQAFGLDVPPGLRVSFEAIGKDGLSMGCLNPTTGSIGSGHIIPIKTFNQLRAGGGEGILIGTDTTEIAWNINIRDVDVSGLERLIPYAGITTYSGHISHYDDGGSVIYDLSSMSLSQPCEPR